MRQTVGGAQNVVMPRVRDDVQQRGGVEALVVEDRDRRLGEPGREDVAPGVLGPAGRAEVQMHVAGLQAEPVHRREVPDGIGGVGVLDELRPRGRAAGEVQEQRVARARGAVGREALGRRSGVA